MQFNFTFPYSELGDVRLQLFLRTSVNTTCSQIFTLTKLSVSQRPLRENGVLIPPGISHCSPLVILVSIITFYFLICLPHKNWTIGVRFSDESGNMCVHASSRNMFKINNIVVCNRCN